MPSNLSIRPKPVEETPQRRFPPHYRKRFIDGVENTPFGELEFEIYGTKPDGTLDLPVSGILSEEQERRLQELAPRMIFRPSSRCELRFRVFLSQLGQTDAY
jgi:hypothetical protein